MSKILSNVSIDGTLSVSKIDVNTVAVSGAAQTIPASEFHDITMDQDCTFTFPTPQGNAFVFALTLRGAFTATFPASVDWSGGAPPTYAAPSLYVFSTSDGGTVWLGSQIGSAFA